MNELKTKETSTLAIVSASPFNKLQCSAVFEICRHHSRWDKYLLTISFTATVFEPVHSSYSPRTLLHPLLVHPCNASTKNHLISTFRRSYADLSPILSYGGWPYIGNTVMLWVTLYWLCLALSNLVLCKAMVTLSHGRLWDVIYKLV